jgi:hypothetical protein
VESNFKCKDLESERWWILLLGVTGSLSTLHQRIFYLEPSCNTSQIVWLGSTMRKLTMNIFNNGLHSKSILTFCLTVLWFTHCAIVLVTIQTTIRAM